jgi:hypothetical protein
MLLIPFPILILGPGLVPPARHLMLGAIALLFAVVEKGGGVVLALGGGFLLQGALWAGVVWLGAFALAKLLERLPARERLRVAVLLITVGAALALFLPVYHTPFSASHAYSSLWELYR